ncbi:MAG TPA: DUF2490 domain-containing protein [Bacteroidales bacterium]|nr:DUF2490 domain-containing protein [Bacteroidales bacterium]
MPNQTPRTNLLLPTIILFFAAVRVNAQYKTDYQAWQKLEVEAKVARAYGISVNIETRFTDNCSDYTYHFIDFGNYIRIFDKLKLSFDILYVDKKVNKADEIHSIRWQYNLSATYRNRFGRFLFYDRVLNEAQYVDYKPAKNGEVMQDRYLRDKATLRYKLTKRFYPYIEDEIYYRFDRQKHNPPGFNRNRFYAGCLFYVDKLDRFDLFYMREHNFNVTPLTNNNIFGIGFSRSLF